MLEVGVAGGRVERAPSIAKVLIMNWPTLTDDGHFCPSAAVLAAHGWRQTEMSVVQECPSSRNGANGDQGRIANWGLAPLDRQPPKLKPGIEI
jgi:hypothetical protein